MEAERWSGWWSCRADRSNALLDPDPDPFSLDPFSLPWPVQFSARQPSTAWGWKMLKDVERCWKMLKDVERCWKMLKDVERCWKVLKGVERCWKVLKGVERCWKMLKDVERCWKMLKDVERCWKMLKGWSWDVMLEFLDFPNGVRCHLMSSGGFQWPSTQALGSMPDTKEVACQEHHVFLPMSNWKSCKLTLDVFWETPALSMVKIGADCCYFAQVGWGRTMKNTPIPFCGAKDTQNKALMRWGDVFFCQMSTPNMTYPQRDFHQSQSWWAKDTRTYTVSVCTAKVACQKICQRVGANVVYRCGIEHQSASKYGLRVRIMCHVSMPRYVSHPTWHMGVS